MNLRTLHRPLMLTAALMLALVVVSGAGLVLDDRILLGVPIWLKPLKFAISITIYTSTLAWLISLVSRRATAARRLGTVIAGALILEMVVIVGQVVRGRMSHFNAATPLDSALFSVMGATIVAVWIATAWIGVLLMRQRLPDRATAWAVRLGLVIALGGLAIGFLMTSPRSEQLAETAPAALGAHSVGVTDGGPGLPLVNWSTEGGDLRAGHFIGMHALQAIPLFALALVFAGRRIGRLRDERRRTHLIAVAALGYAGVTALVTWQALRGQSLVHPDALTLSAAGALVAAVAIAALLVLARRDERPDLPAGTGTPVALQEAGR